MKNETTFRNFDDEIWAQIKAQGLGKRGCWELAAGPRRTRRRTRGAPARARAPHTRSAAAGASTGRPPEVMGAWRLLGCARPRARRAAAPRGVSRARGESAR